MARTSKRDPQRESRWRKLIERQQSSGMSIRAFFRAPLTQPSTVVLRGLKILLDHARPVTTLGKMRGQGLQEPAQWIASDPFSDPIASEVKLKHRCLPFCPEGLEKHR